MRNNCVVRIIILNLFTFFISLYFLSAPYSIVHKTVASRARYEVTKSIAERFDLSIPNNLGVKGIDGRDYSWFGLGTSIIGIPFYLIGKYLNNPEITVSLMNQLFGAATAVLVFLFSISLGYSKRASVLVSIFYGIGTFAWPLAKQPFDHTIETFFVLLSVYFMYLNIINRKIFYLIFSAFSLGVAFITRPTSILVMPAIFIFIIIYYSRQYGFKENIRLIVRNILLFFLAFLPFLLLTFWYNYYRFGSIFETGYQLMGSRMGIDFFTGTPLLTGLSGFLISPGKGFFYYSPVAILFFFSIKPFMKKHFELFICFICIILFYLLFLSKNIYWHGDWAWGPRYILVLTPFFIIPTAGLLTSNTWIKKKWIRLSVFLVFIVSFVIQIAAVSLDPGKYFFYLIYEEKVKFTKVESYGVQPIVEPPPETHFNWREFPIYKQFKLIYEVAQNMKDYKYSETSEKATNAENIKASLHINIFDFWWVYRYYLNGSYSGFIGALLLLLISLYSASRLRKTIKTEKSEGA